MYTLYKFHFVNGISEINQLFDDILIIRPAPVCVCVCVYIYIYILVLHNTIHIHLKQYLLVYVNSVNLYRKFI